MIWLWNKFFLRLSVRCEDILSRRTQGWQISLGQTKWMLAHTWLKYATSWLPTVCVGDFFFFFFLGSRGSRDSSALHQSLRRAYVDLFLCINSLTPHKRPIYAQQATTSNRSCFAYRIMYLHRKVHACVCVCVCVCVLSLKSINTCAEIASAPSGLSSEEVTDCTDKNCCQICMIHINIDRCIVTAWQTQNKVNKCDGTEPLSFWVNSGERERLSVVLSLKKWDQMVMSYKSFSIIHQLFFIHAL